MDMAFNAVTRGTLPGISAGNAPRAVEGNQHGDLVVSQHLPERAMLTSRGVTWFAQPLVANFSTLLQAQPSSGGGNAGAYNLCLVNNDPLLTYIIERAWIWNTTSMAGATGEPISILAALVPPSNPINTFANGTLLAPANIHNNSGKPGSYAGYAIIQTASAGTDGQVTSLPAVGPGSYFTLGKGLIADPTTNLGCTVEAQCYGRYLIRPGGCFLLAGMGGAGVGHYVCGVEWHEALLPLN